MNAFRTSLLFPIVAVAAFTGARRGEILALRWVDLDVANKRHRIERSVEKTKTHGFARKEPKRDRHERTITIDDEPATLLCAARVRHLRLMAGIPEGASVDLSLVRLPADALMFANAPELGEDFSFIKRRNPDNMTKEFCRWAAKLGFPHLCFHDLRGTHETLWLDAGIPVKAVAERCGHDPAVLLRIYAKRTKKADTSAAAVLGALSNCILGG